jgi:hypothetical protein
MGHAWLGYEVTKFDIFAPPSPEIEKLVGCMNARAAEKERIIRLKPCKAFHSSLSLSSFVSLHFPTISLYLSLLSANFTFLIFIADPS